MDGEQFATYVRDFFASGRILSLEIRADKVHVHGNAAYEFRQYDERVVAGTDTLTLANHYAMRWERDDDGTWRIDHLVAGPRSAQ